MLVDCNGMRGREHGIPAGSQPAPCWTDGGADLVRHAAGGVPDEETAVAIAAALALLSEEPAADAPASDAPAWARAGRLESHESRNPRAGARPRGRSRP